MFFGTLKDRKFHNESGKRAPKSIKEERPYGRSLWLESIMLFDFSVLLKVTIQQTLECLAVSCLVAKLHMGFEERKLCGAWIFGFVESFEKVELSNKIPIREDIMAKASSGVYQLPNGIWGFRYAFWLDSKSSAPQARTAIHSRPRGRLSKQEKRLSSKFFYAFSSLFQPHKEANQFGLD